MDALVKQISHAGNSKLSPIGKWISTPSVCTIAPPPPSPARATRYVISGADPHQSDYDSEWFSVRVKKGISNQFERMAQDDSIITSSSNEVGDVPNASTSRTRRSLTRVRRDASAELDDASASEYSEHSGSDSSEDDDEQGSGSQNKVREASDDSDEPRSKRPKYPTLQSQSKTVKGQIVQNNWRPTTATAQAKVRNLLSLVQRPVMNSYSNLERRKEAQASLADLERTFAKRVPKIRFPLNAKEWHFDYEAILRNNRDLEQQLAAAKHGSGLVQAEIKKERQLLAEAKVDLKELEQNANAERKARVQRERGITQLWKDTNGAEPDNADHIGLQDLSQSVNAAIKSADTLSFMPALEHHLSNMEDNLNQLGGLPEVIDSTSNLLRLHAMRSSE